MALLPSIIHAQTITVADGTVSNTQLPIGYESREQHRQMIYPADMLNIMPGSQIQSIKFYASSSYSSLPNFTVKVGEVPITRFTSNSAVLNPTASVYMGGFQMYSNTLTINFSTPYYYHGGNLLIDISTPNSCYTSTYFKGITVTGGGATISSGYLNAIDFLPKLTITYACPSPRAFSVSNANAQSATISWSPGDSETSWDIYETSTPTDVPNSNTSPNHTVSTPNYTVSGLNSSSTRNVYVRANCGGGTVSDWVMCFGNTVKFVATNGNDMNDGNTWETAKATIQAGVQSAGNNGTIFVKAGQYNTSSEINIPAGTSVLGGYAPSSTGTDTTQRHLPGTNSHWDDASYCTIINGSRTHRIASIGEGALLEGCVLQNGTTNADGGGAFVDGGTLRYAIVRWCDAIHLENGTATGGGVYIRNNGQLLNSVITECRADNGSAIAGENGIATNNTITRNWPANCGTVDDYDGNTYHSIIIGDQCWMRENLRCSHYADGGIIPRNTSGNRYASPYYFYYYYSDDLLVGYGYHYNWAAAMNGANSTNAVPSGVQGICPNGWHLPSKAEYEIMLNFVNSFARYRCNNTNQYIAKSLAANRDWNSYSSSACYTGTNISSNNSTYFSAMPAGYYTSGSSATNRQTIAFFLTSTLESNSRAWSCRISYNDPNVTWDNLSYDYGYSIRCVKNQQ